MLLLWKTALLVLAVTGGAPSASQEENHFWRDQRGNPIADTRSRKSVGGFGAWLVVTSDQDYEQKLNASAGTMPSFTEATAVQKGGRLFILLLFSNPALTKAGLADVKCDIEAERPDKTFVARKRDLTCFAGPLGGSARQIYRSTPVLDFLGEEGDPIGEWRVRVKMKDRVRGVEVPLETSFTLE